MRDHSSFYASHIEVPTFWDLHSMAVDFLKARPMKIPLNRVMDSMALFVYYVHRKHTKQVQKGKISKRGYVVFRVDHRRKLLGRSEVYYIQFLVKHGYLQTRPYKINRSSTGYKVVFPARKRSWSDYTITDKPSLKRLHGLREKSCAQIDELMLRVATTTGALSPTLIMMHHEVWGQLDKMRVQELESANDEEEERNIETKFKTQADDVTMINAGDYSEKRDRKGFRLHSRMVRMMKELRPFLILNGESANEVDIKNSQPFLMQVVTRPSLWTEMPHPGKLHISDLDEGMVLKLKEQSIHALEVMNIVDGHKRLTTAKLRERKIEVEREEERVNPMERRGSILLLAVSLQNRDEPNGLNFIRLAATGTLYETLSSEYNNKFFDRKGNDLLSDKDTAKQTIISELFADYRKLPFRGYRSVIETLFPHFFLFMILVKETGFRNLSILLQRVEAWIFLEGAVGSFLVQHPGTPVVTVHDSVMVPRSLTRPAKEHIENYIEKVVGTRPKCTVKESPVRDANTFCGITADEVFPFYS
jgi:hypothetical protein